MNRSLTIILLILAIGGIGVAIYAANKKKAAAAPPAQPVKGDPPTGNITVVIDRKPVLHDTTISNDK